MFVVWVDIQVKPAHIEEFIAATALNHQGTRQEPGNKRFDVLQLNNERTHFRLYEVYDDEDAFRSHQQTAHYSTWKSTVEPYMAVPRSAEKLTALFPTPWA